MSSIATASDSFGYLPQPGQLIYFDKPSGQSVNLTSLLSGGAKFTVIYDAVCGKVSHPGKAGDALYHRLKRQIERWEKEGYVRISRNVIDPLNVAQFEKRGLYVQTTVNLIKGMQNSNTFCKTDPPLTEHKYSLLHSQFPRRCGPRRREAIGTALRIRQYYLFKRPDPSRLNPHLAERITRMENKFHRWEEECEEKRIILSRLPGAPPGKPYTILPMTTRFTNEGRKVELLKTYEKAIENAANLFEDAVFLTFTTDPMIHLSPEGQPVQRVIKSKDGKTVLDVFNTTGRGTSLYEANRHESTAWRKWYEAETRRRGYRIPYIRVAEFMKNGLIHTHVILFGLKWAKPFNQLAREWGEKYQQGFMVHAYVLQNKDKKWTWKNEKNTPDDARGRSPDDYLKKYLKKALYDTSSHWGYWVHNKRFYTMSQSIRYADATEAAAAKAERAANKNPIPEYEFVGAVPEDEIPDIIRRHSRGWQKEPVEPYEMPASGTPDSPARYPGPASWRPEFTPAGQWRYNDPAAVAALTLEIAIPDPPDTPPAQDEPRAETYLELIRRLKREAKEKDSLPIQ
jgi:hypothetical protein